MRILIVSATELELASLLNGLDDPPEATRDEHVRTLTHRGHAVDVLVTGVGMVATAALCSQTLTRSRYDLAFNFGLCGSYDSAIVPGAVVHVVADRLSELGAEDNGAFLTLQDLKLIGPDDFPYTHGEIVNTAPPLNIAVAQLPAVRGITVNTVHGHADSIAAIRARFAPQVESMEGAAFMYSCKIAGVPFAQVRAVSNIVEPRNRAGWRVAEALEALARTGVRAIEHA